MDYLKKIIEDIETHSVEGIKECFAYGIDPNMYYKGEPLIYELTSEYARGPRFKECVKAFVEHGLVFEDGTLLAVLLDNPEALDSELKKDPGAIEKKYSLRCAYTPLYEVSLLHICSEFNHVSCAEILVKRGVDINSKAGVDEHGFGGQTPIFHTVNQNTNQSAEMLNYLLSRSADLKITVAGLVWGKGYDWETLIPAVNPISYAMMGLLPQMHRSEQTVNDVIAVLLKHQYNTNYTSPNVPNKYLHP